MLFYIQVPIANHLNRVGTQPFRGCRKKRPRDEMYIFVYRNGKDNGLLLASLGVKPRFGIYSSENIDNFVENLSLRKPFSSVMIQFTSK